MKYCEATFHASPVATSARLTIMEPGISLPTTGELGDLAWCAIQLA